MMGPMGMGMGMKEQAPSFGLVLQQYRVAAGLSQEELAERAGLSRRGITDLERGARRSPHPATVRRLAEALRLAEPDRLSLAVAARAATRTARTSVVPQQPPSVSNEGEHKQATVLCSAWRG